MAQVHCLCSPEAALRQSMLCCQIVPVPDQLVCLQVHGMLNSFTILMLLRLVLTSHINNHSRHLPISLVPEVKQELEVFYSLQRNKFPATHFHQAATQ